MIDAKKLAEKMFSTERLHALLQDHARILSGFVPTLKGAELMPMLFLINGEKQVALPCPLPEEKHETMFKLGMFVGRARLIVMAVVFVSEAWKKEMSVAESVRMAEHFLPPSKCPDRQEIIR